MSPVKFFIGVWTRPPSFHSLWYYTVRISNSQTFTEYEGRVKGKRYKNIYIHKRKLARYSPNLKACLKWAKLYK